MTLLPRHIIEKKQQHQKISMLTAYDAVFGRILDEAGVDIVLVGDSMGNVVLGYKNTLPVTMEDILHHCKAVRRGVSRALLIADMPFMSFEVSDQEAIYNAGRLIKEGGAQAVKIEVGPNTLSRVAAIVGMGIPVMAHLGFTPQSVYQQGGYRVQGREAACADLMKSLATDCERMGCFSVLLEMVPVSLATDITHSLAIPTIGIGAGNTCDGQVLVTHDLVGFSDGKIPKFVRQYGALFNDMTQYVIQYIADIQSGDFPSQEESFK